MASRFHVFELIDSPGLQYSNTLSWFSLYYLSARENRKVDVKNNRIVFLGSSISYYSQRLIMPPRWPGMHFYDNLRCTPGYKNAKTRS